MEAHPRFEQSESLSKSGEVQDGNTRNHQNFPSARGMGHLNRLHGRLLPSTDTGTIQEIPEISRPGADIPIQGHAFWSVHSSSGIHGHSQGSEVNGHAQGYKNPPVPRRLVGEGQVPHSLSPAYQRSTENMPGPRLVSQQGEIRAGTKTSLRLCRLPIRPRIRPGQTHTRPLAGSHSKDSSYLSPADLSGPAVHVLDRSLNGHRKASLSRPSAHEARSMAPQEQLEGTGIIRKGHSHTRFSTSTSKMVVGGKQCVARTTFTPTKPCSADLYRRIKRRVGRSLRRTHSQRRVVSTGKQTAHQLPRVESSLSGTKRVSKPLFQQASTGGHRQHYSSVLHKQGRWHEVGPSVCPSVENFDLVYDQPSNPQSPSHPGAAKCGSGQAIQTRPDYSDGMVSPHRNLSGYMLQVAPTSGGPLRHEVQQQTASVCVCGAGPLSDCSRCTQHTLGEPGCLRFPTGGHLGQSGGKVTELPRQQDSSDCSGLAQHALVLGPGGHVQPNPMESSQRATPSDTALQSDPSQKSDKSKSPRMAPRATAIKDLFEVKNLQPSTIDGYRSAIADKLGKVTLNISKDDNLTRLLDSFHRDRPKGRRGIPSWNLSLVLHQLTKAPFEPLREASLKHLTFKTVFLLALGSGKRRSEIHAWQNKNIRHQSDWSKVSLFPSPSFLSKNQLAKEGPESVAPVVIPALAPTLDRSLKSDRSLCPVRALRYYLDRTSDIRQGKELVFVSFKKSFDKDISPATISSWIKQTVILCYELSDHQAHTLHQVKAHDVRAFAASKAFQSGVSLEQILSACHWKSHNIFTQFYLKDVAWADSELYHLGPVVAAQQIHQQANT